MTDPTFEKIGDYGDAVIGERGQIVVPAGLRKKYGIQKGDRFIVMTAEKSGSWRILLVKAGAFVRIV